MARVTEDHTFTFLSCLYIIYRIEKMKDAKWVDDITAFTMTSAELGDISEYLGKWANTVLPEPLNKRLGPQNLGYVRSVNMTLDNYFVKTQVYVSGSRGSETEKAVIEVLNNEFNIAHVMTWEQKGSPFSLMIQDGVQAWTTENYNTEVQKRTSNLRTFSWMNDVHKRLRRLPMTEQATIRQELLDRLVE